MLRRTGKGTGGDDQRGSMVKVSVGEEKNSKAIVHGVGLVGRGEGGPGLGGAGEERGEEVGVGGAQ